MKHFFTFLLFIAAIPVAGQAYYPLLRNNVFWDVFEYEAGPVCNLSGAYRYFISGDTSVNNIDYKIISYHPIVSLLPQPSPFCWPFAVDGDSTALAFYFMREDTVQQKVYVFDHLNSNQEYLLFDFSLSVGDTINSSYSGANSPFVIDSIGNYIMPDGSNRRIFYGKVPWWSTEFYIEGVGASTGLFRPLAWAIGAGSRLSCVLDNDTSIYSDPIMAYGCLGYVGLNEVNSSLELTVSPNPTSTILSLKLPNTIIGVFELTDSSGKLVLSKEISDKETNIEVAQIDKGLYFYRFISEDRKVATGKLLLQN